MLRDAESRGEGAGGYVGEMKTRLRDLRSLVLKSLGTGLGFFS